MTAPTPELVLERFEAALNPLDDAHDRATHYSVPIEVADAVLATFRQQQEQLRAAEARVVRLREDLRRERLSHSNTIDQRDHAEKAADRLAYALFDIDEIGEHSSANCPWANAAKRLEALKNAVERLEALKGATP